MPFAPHGPPGHSYVAVLIEPKVKGVHAVKDRYGRREVFPNRIYQSRLIEWKGETRHAMFAMNANDRQKLFDRGWDDITDAWHAREQALAAEDDSGLLLTGEALDLLRSVDPVGGTYVASLGRGMNLSDSVSLRDRLVSAGYLKIERRRVHLTEIGRAAVE